ARYWAHLSGALLPEAAPTHGFHVFGVYPWSRLLRSPATGEALRVLDECRIRWGRVVGVDGEHVIVTCRRLGWDGTRLALRAAGEQRVRMSVDGEGFVTDPRPGQWLALHWDWVCDRLTDEQRHELARGTEWQLAVTNDRLAREAAG
ncbi:MAG: DUF6390 family protein, partial [Trebonia sp.]